MQDRATSGPAGSAISTSSSATSLKTASSWSKFYLNVSRKEQKKRLLERIERPEKNWKFSLNDVKQRSLAKGYRRAYEDVLSRTSTKVAPWYVIPADHKWFTRLAVAAVTRGHASNGSICTFPS